MMASEARVLDPGERIAEVLFGLIMVLTFTGSLSIADAGRDDVRIMLIGALGCNLAWGLIDAVLYLMGCLAERGRDRETYRAIRQSATPEQARRLIAAALPPILSCKRSSRRLSIRRTGGCRTCRCRRRPRD